MPDNLREKIPLDAERINLSEPYEIEYWTEKFGCTEQELRDAVHQKGDSADKVEHYLQNH